MGKITNTIKGAIHNTIKGTKWLKQELTTNYCRKCGKQLPPKTKYNLCYQCYKEQQAKHPKRRKY